MITVPIWALWVVGSYLVLNAFSGALSLTDRSPYKFFVRFVRGLALNFSTFAEKELHVQLPEVPEVPEAQDPTQADVTTPSAK
jgi:hypothetical protein